MLKDDVVKEMKEVYRHMPKGITHTLNVLKYAEDIMDSENLTEEEKELISISAILHDIGIPEAIGKYGSKEAKYQEREGALIAKELLDKLGYPPVKRDRVTYIVGHHHTKSKIDGLDFQIIWEADMLVNLENKDLTKEELKVCIEDNFMTKVGKKIASEKYLLD